MESTHSGDEELIKLYSRKDEMELEVNTAEQAYYASRGEIDQVEKDLRGVQHQRENIDALLMQLQNELNESKLELNSVKERLSVEFNVAVDDIMTQLTAEESLALAEEDVEKLRQDVARVRERIDNMGPINPMAMEAYNEIKERNDFIIAQKEEIGRAHV